MDMHIGQCHEPRYHLPELWLVNVHVRGMTGLLSIRGKGKDLTYHQQCQMPLELLKDSDLHSTPRYHGLTHTEHIEQTHVTSLCVCVCVVCACGVCVWCVVCVCCVCCMCVCSVH